MPIMISEDGTKFRVDTENSTYAFGTGASGYLNHFWYGKRAGTDSPETFAELENVSFNGLSFSPYRKLEHLNDARNLAMQECTTHALGDYRTPSVSVMDANGIDTTDPQFVSARKFAGRPEISGMPCARVNGDLSVETLEILLRDPATNVEYLLDYTVFPKQDCIVRSMLVRNVSERPVKLTRAMSFCLDFRDMDYDLVQTPGTYGRERYGFDRSPLHPGMQGFFSTRTSSGHDHNPAFALASHHASELAGEVYGFILVYSGSFSVEIEGDPFFRTRVTAGIAPDTFEWTLQPGESFRTPEAILTWTENGLSGMSRNFHDMLREHLISPKWAHADRPILVNNWEGTGMAFTREKLLDIADVAASCGIELFVLDDGWFGHRDNDRSSLGDWFVYQKKVGDLKSLAEAMNAKGLKFGLWFEPEMVSKDSELYKAHPEWHFTVPDREATYGRHQWVLNMGLPEVVDYLFETISGVLRSAPIVYMKWDMNRQPAEISSAILPPDRQKEAGHRYVLGVYELHRRLIEAFPDLLIEGCSGGGGRFDAGMLYYVPQIWTSDNTDAVDRLFIQSSTSLFYPCSAQGAHVSFSPNHATNRNTPLETRGAVALAGTFGYELDMTVMSEEERKTVREQCAAFRKWHHLVADGDQYRLQDPWDGDQGAATWEFAAKDASEMLMIHVRFRQIVSPGVRFIRLSGLDPEKTYRLEQTGKTFTGAFLMSAGLPLPSFRGEGNSVIWHFTAL